MPRLRLTVLAASLLALGVAAPAQAVDEVLVDFETGPALETQITDQYQASAFVFFQNGDGGHPYRRSAPGKARSGSVVANIGADLCAQEGGTGNQCELPTGGAGGRLTRTASSIKLYAGLFSGASGPVTVRIEAFRANGSAAATGAPVTVGTSGFTSLVSVTSAAADIARFHVTIGGTGAQGAAVGFDDLTIVYPEGSLPDVSLAVNQGASAIPQGGSVDIPVGLTRLNGSNGPEDMSVTGLPAGVTGEFLPDPVPGTGSTTTLRLTAAADAPPAPMGVPTDITITADPQGSGAVAPEARSITKPVRVASPYLLRATGATVVGVPTCTSVDVPLRLERDFAFSGAVHLAALNLPTGVVASFTPGPDIPAGGNFFLDITLRLTGPTAPIPTTTATIEASSPGTPTRRLPLTLVRAIPVATIGAPAKLVAPQKLRAGTTGRITGDGFCPGTKLQIGTAAGEVTPSVEDGGHALGFVTPRLATSGKITVVPPLGPAYATANDVAVETFRSKNGLNFVNPPYLGLSLTEAADVFGYDELFFKVNPCWPLGNCSIITPVPDPTAFIAYGIIDHEMKASGGHCFGISRSVQGWTSNPATLNQFTGGGTVFSIPETDGLKSYLDGQHATQASTEFIQTYFRRPKDLTSNVNKIRSLLNSGNLPLVSLAYSSGGHAVIAYDLVDRPDGGVDILVYDNNQPFQSQELTTADSHRIREGQRSIIHVDAARSRWDFDSGSAMRTGDGSKLFASERNAIPDDPTLPGATLLLEGLAYVIFGSDDGSARSEGPPAGADALPVLDENAPDGAAGVVGRTDGKPIEHTMRGVKAGRYEQAVVGSGFVAGVDVPTAPGIRDKTSGVAGGDGVHFAALGDAPSRALTLDVGTDGKTSSRSASVDTRTAGGGDETVRLADGKALTYTHDGPPTTVRFTLRSVQTNGGPATFESGPVTVGRGETLTATPASWTSLTAVKLTTRTKAGGGRTRVLRNRAKAPASLAITRLRARGATATITTRVGRLPEFGAAGIVLRATRGGKAVARKLFKVEKVKTGTRTFRWTLPKAARGRGRGLRLVADVSLAVGGVRNGTVRRHRSVAVG